MKEAINNAISKQLGQVPENSSIIHFNFNIKNRPKKKKKGLYYPILSILNTRKFPREIALYRVVWYPYGFSF